MKVFSTLTLASLAIASPVQLRGDTIPTIEGVTVSGPGCPNGGAQTLTADKQVGTWIFQALAGFDNQNSASRDLDCTVRFKVNLPYTGGGCNNLQLQAQFFGYAKLTDGTATGSMIPYLTFSGSGEVKGWDK